MGKLNLTDIVRIKTGKDLTSAEAVPYKSNFTKTCNKKMNIIDLTIQEFKSENGKYELSKDTVMYLTEIERFTLTRNFSNFTKMNTEIYEEIQLFLDKLLQLVQSHFKDDKLKYYEMKINTLKSNVELNNFKSEIFINAFNLNEKPNEAIFSMQQGLEQLIMDTYSTENYPNLTFEDRFVLVNQLVKEVTSAIEDYQTLIELANDIRGSEGDNKNLDINEILTRY